MNDPDDIAPGSGDDDWELNFSPSISSLSSFAPEEFSFSSQQQHHYHPEPDPMPNSGHVTQPTSPRRPPQQQPQRDYHDRNDAHNHPPTQTQQQQQKEDSEQERERSRQKQHTPPLQRPPKHQHQQHITTATAAQISIPIQNLHTPPPTSPRRRPGILSRLPSANHHHHAAAAAGSGGITSPTNMSSRSNSSTLGSLGLHMGTGTGRGVGLGAGLPISPLGLHRAGPPKGHGHGLGLGLGRGRLAGEEVREQRQEGQGQGQRPSPSRVRFATEGREEEEELEEEEVEEEVGVEEDRGLDDRDRDQGHDAVGKGADSAGEFWYGHDEDDADDADEATRHSVAEDVHVHEDEDSGGYQDSEREESSFWHDGGTTESHRTGEGDDHVHADEDPRTLNDAQGEESSFWHDGGTQNVGGRTGGGQDEDEADGLHGDGRGEEEGDEERRWHEGVQGDEEEIIEVDTENLPPARVELMERLCDLVQRLSSAKVGGGMEADVLDVLHSKVDEMEELLLLAEETAEAEATAELEAQVEEQSQPAGQPEEQPRGQLEGQSKSQPPPVEQPEVEVEAPSDTKPQSEGRRDAATQVEEEALEEVRSGYRDDSRPSRGRSPAAPSVPLLQLGDQDIRDLTSPSPIPWLTTNFRFSELDISPTRSQPELAAATNEALEAAKRAAQAQIEAAERVAREAERMNVELAAMVKRLQVRKEESDHLHALLVDRAEAAATRILDLEQEICDLEDDILANESELRHLRLKIRAVETLCYEFVPPDADPDLFQSIENWKADWVLVRDRMLERKKDRKARRLRLHRAGCVISSLEQREQEEASTLTSLGGLSMSVSLLGLRSTSTPRKAY